MAPISNTSTGRNIVQRDGEHKNTMTWLMIASGSVILFFTLLSPLTLACLFVQGWYQFKVRL